MIFSGLQQTVERRIASPSVIKGAISLIVASLMLFILPACSRQVSYPAPVRIGSDIVISTSAPKGWWTANRLGYESDTCSWISSKRQGSELPPDYRPRPNCRLRWTSITETFSTPDTGPVRQSTAAGPILGCGRHCSGCHDYFRSPCTQAGEANQGHGCGHPCHCLRPLRHSYSRDVIERVGATCPGLQRRGNDPGETREGKESMDSRYIPRIADSHCRS